MQGRSLVPLMQGKTPDDWRKTFYYHYYEFPGAHSVARHYGVTDGEHKLIHYYRVGEWELFDLEKDPEELTSVHGKPEYAAVTKALEAELERLQAEVGESEPEAPVPGDPERRRRTVRPTTIERAPTSTASPVWAVAHRIVRELDPRGHP